MEEKTEAEIAWALDLEDIADPFGQPPRTFLTLLLADAKYATSGNNLKQLLD